MRLTLILLSCILFSYAEDIEYCGGKYRDTVDLINRTTWFRGTLYTGRKAYASIENTIEFYRLWRGLPQLQADPTLPETHIQFFSKSSRLTEEDIKSYLWVAEVEPTLRSQYELDDATYALNALTLADKPINWWLIDGYYDAQKPIQTMVANVAQHSDFLNWLQFAATAASTPWVHEWDYTPLIASDYAVYRQLQDVALEKYKEQGGIEWMVIAMLFQNSNEIIHSDYRSKNDNERIMQLEEMFITWNNRVFNCDATPSEYAAWSIVLPSLLLSHELRTLYFDEKLYEVMPSSIKFSLIEKLVGMNRPPYYQSHGLPSLEGLYAFLDEKHLNSDLFHSFIKREINDLRTQQLLGYAITHDQDISLIDNFIEINNDERTRANGFMRAINVLSTKNIEYLLTHMTFSEKERKTITSALFARYVALENDAIAMALIPKLMTLFPEYKDKVKEILKRNVPNKVKLAMIVLDYPTFSTAIEPNYEWGDRRRDLSRRGVYGSLMAELIAYYEFDFYDYKKHPLISWDELGHFIQNTGLTHKISRNIILWAEEQTQSRLKRTFSSQKYIAEYLHKVVVLNRYEYGGEWKGNPVGKLAFKILHRHFKDDQWTQETPYWYVRD